MTSSIASERASPALGAYGAAKAALNGVVRGIAAEWEQWNIRANALAPSMVRRRSRKSVLPEHPRRRKSDGRQIPSNRIAEPDDIVGAAILLASPAGSYISGQTLLNRRGALNYLSRTARADPRCNYTKKNTGADNNVG
ncbi:SDR family NAD(P)-dependent oxidoreductase [Cupriavidus basilensis]